jgi:hypothetical protein
MKTFLDKAARNDKAAPQTLRYFDPLELAPELCGPVLTSAVLARRTFPK